MQSPRPTISRETRLLLGIAALSVAMLWVLARIRFPERAADPNPVAPVLAQLAPPPAFESLAVSMSQIQPTLESSLVALPVGSPVEDGLERGGPVAALRLGEGIALVHVPRRGGGPQAHGALDIVANDPLLPLAIVRVPVSGVPDNRPAAWLPRRLQSPRFLVAAEVSRHGVVFRPFFVAALHPVMSVVWAQEVWAVPDRTDVGEGTFVFSEQGTLAGLVVAHESSTAIVPAQVLLAAADRIRLQPASRPGALLISVQALTPEVAAATGAGRGMVVTWVDPAGPAAGTLAVADVIESADGEPLLGEEVWRARSARFPVGQPVVFQVRRGGELLEKQITPVQAPDPSPTAERPLGLVLRGVAGGAEVVRVDPESAAARAGMQPADVITMAGSVRAPQPAQIRRLYAGAERGLLIAFTRGASHHVVALQRRW